MQRMNHVRRAYRTKAKDLSIKEIRLKWLNSIKDYKDCVTKLRHTYVKQGLIPQVLIDMEKINLISYRKKLRDCRYKVECILEGLNLYDLFKITTKTDVSSNIDNTVCKV